jgi:hypothetical protein
MAMANAMNSPWSRVRAQWASLRRRVAAFWPRLPPEEVQRLPGDRASLVGLVRRCYALTFAEAEAQVDTWLAELEEERDAPAVESAAPPPAWTESEARAEGEGMGVVPGATTKPPG